jgi:hypothetical protein
VSESSCHHFFNITASDVLTHYFAQMGSSISKHDPENIFFFFNGWNRPSLSKAAACI